MPSPSQITLAIPVIPPGLNHYVRHTRAGRHYVTKDASSFKEHIVFAANGRWVESKFFKVEATIWLGEGERGDVDGFGKLILDGLAKAQVFRTPTRKGLKVASDAWVYDLHLRKRRSDDGSSSTEITVTAL